MFVKYSDNIIERFSPEAIRNVEMDLGISIYSHIDPTHRCHMEYVHILPNIDNVNINFDHGVEIFNGFVMWLSSRPWLSYVNNLRLYVRQESVVSPIDFTMRVVLAIRYYYD